MKINEAANEALVRAAMFQEDRNAEALCAEDILYGLLSLACDKTVKDEWRSEIARLSERLKKELGDLDSAMKKLEAKAVRDPSDFLPADVVLERASELWVNDELNAEVLCRAFFDVDPKSLPALRSGPEIDETIFDLDDLDDEATQPELNSSFDSDFSGDMMDVTLNSALFDSLGSEDTVQPNVFSDLLASIAEDTFINDDEAAPGNDDAVLRELLKLIAGEKGGGNQAEEERKRREEEERKRREEEERKRREEEERKRREEQDRKKREEEQKRKETERLLQKQAEKNKKQRTKMGLFSYRGGPTAAAVKYYLWGIFAPLLGLSALDMFTGILSTPANKGMEYLGYALVFCWGFYLLRGINLIVYRKNVNWGFFLDILEDTGLFWILLSGVSITFYGGQDPLWLRIVLVAGTCVLLGFGCVMINELPEDEDRQIIVFVLNKLQEGSAARLILKGAMGLLLILTVAGSPSFFGRVYPGWLEKTLLVAAFLLLWSYLFSVWNCLVQRSELPALRYTARKGFVKFMQGFHIMAAPGELLLWLHWVFDWSPMRLWVRIVVGLFAVLGVMGGIAHSKSD